MSSWEEEFYPWLVYHHGEQRQNQSFCGITSSDELCVDSQSIPELSNKKVMYYSIDGWLLLLRASASGDEEEMLSIYNRVTLESLALPRVRVRDIEEDVMFEYIDKGQAIFTSSSPIDPNCLILLFLGVTPKLLYCRVGEQCWRVFDYAQSIQALIPSVPHKHRCCLSQLHDLHTCTQLLHQPVRVSGKIYALSSCSLDLVQIDIYKSNIWSLSLISKLRPPGRAFPNRAHARTSFLVSWADEFIYQADIFLSSSPHLKSRLAPEIMLKVFNFTTKSWSLKDKLDGCALFLGTRYSFACHWSSHLPNKWSGIYFTSGYNHNILSSYSMEDGTITSYSPCPTPNLPQDPPQWIMPFEDAQHVEPKGPPSFLSLFAKKLSSFVDYINFPWNQNAVKRQGKGMRKRVYADVVLLMDMGCSKKQRIMVDKHESDGVMVEVHGSAHPQGLPSFSDLPQELLALIAERHLYSPVSYFHFPLINRSCATTRTSLARKNPFHPCLIYSDKANGVYHITDSKLSHQLSVKIPDVLKTTKIFCSRDGWILLNGYYGSNACSYYLFNPFTNQIVGRVHGSNQYGKYGISNITFLGKPSPSSPQDCFVLGMSLLSSRGASRLQPGVPNNAGKAEWWTLVVGAANQPIEFVPGCSSPVPWRDCWYYLGDNGRLGRLHFSDMKEKIFEWNVEKHSCPCQNYTQSYLSECGGELVSVFIGDCDKESQVRVFKLGDEKWEEINSLRNHTLYLGWPSSMCCRAESMAMADRIYFPIFYNDSLVYYSLKTRKYHSDCQEEDEVKSFHGTTMFSDCAWIKPAIVG